MSKTTVRGPEANLEVHQLTDDELVVGEESIFQAGRATV